MEKIMKVIAVTLITVFFSLASYEAGKSRVYAEKGLYFYRTEALLDSIHSWDSSFMDSVMETDVYYDYEEARDFCKGIQK